MTAYVESVIQGCAPKTASGFVRPEPAVWVALATGVVVSLLTPNPLLTVACLLVLPVLIVLLWRRGEVPILLFAATYQWLQVSTKVFQANLLGLPVAEVGLTPTVEAAVWMGLLAVVVLALGMRLALRGALPPRNREAAAEAGGISLSRAFGFYLACAVVGASARGAAWAVPGLTQIALAVEGVKWVGFFVLGYVVLSQHRGYLVLFGATVFEFVQGIGFFSGFKTVIFVFALVVFTVYSRLNGRTVGLGLAGLAGLLILGSAWTNVKSEYRAFLNQGSGLQQTVVTRDEQFDKLGDLVGALTWDDVALSLDPLLSRVAYVDFFAVSMDYVPSVVPHEGGGVWIGAFENLVPRLLYPDKPVLLSDSEHTMRYTGLHMASDDQGTSISLGYVADSYVDFGGVWMYLPVLLIGMLWGGMYRYFVSRSSSALLGFAFAMASLLAAYKFEIAAVKLLAGVVIKFVVLVGVLRALEGPMLDWLGVERGGVGSIDGQADESDDPSARPSVRGFWAAG